MWAIISCFYIEKGIYITEEDTFSYITGGTFRLVFYILLFFLGVLFSIRITGGTKKQENLYNFNYQSKAIKIYFLIFTTLSFVFFLNSLFTFILYEPYYTRFSFWEYAVFSPLQPILNQVYITPVFLGLVASNYLYNGNLANKVRIYKVLIIINALFIILGIILQKHKFTPIYIGIILFLIPLLTKVKLNLKKILKSSIVVLLGICLIVLLTYNEYAQNKYIGPDQVFDFMLYRALGLQGHVWWGTDARLSSLSSFHFEQQIINEFKAIFGVDKDTIKVGMKSLMVFLGDEIGYRYIENNVNFTNGFPAIILYSFGRIASIPVVFLLGFLLGILIRIFDSFINSNRIFPTIIMTKIYLDSFELYIMGNMYAFFSLKTLLLLIVIIFYVMVTNYKRKFYLTKKTIIN